MNTKIISPKTTTKTDDLKSSFKPYKQEFKLAPFSKPYSEGLTTSSPSAAPYGYSYCHGRFPSGLVPTDMVEKERNGNCAAPQYYDQNREMNVHSMMKCHPGSNITVPKSSPYVGHEHECTHCNVVRGANMSMSSQNASVAAAAAVAAARGSTSVCPCGLCSQMRGHPESSNLKQNSQMCQYQSMNSVYPNLKTSPHGTVCRDPHCQNCAGKYPQQQQQQHSTVGLQNYIHPALIHQCTHGGSRPGQGSLPGTGSPNGLGSESYMKPKPPTAHPFICNWVAEGKHCGKSFISSEELLQHLRSHTSLMHAQSQNQSPCPSQEAMPMPHHQLQQASCNVHGCPCRLKPAGRPAPYSPYPTPGNSSSLRYHPYGGLGSVNNSGAGSYSYLPHGMMHY